MHWTYAESVDAKQLNQGDVLARTPALDQLLKEVHPYFHDRADNLYFMVLTQTCDLVRRPKAKAEYIAICPVRPVTTIIDRTLGQFVSVSQGSIPVGTQKDKQRFKEFLTRLLNNNEPGYFYLYRDEVLSVDCCAVTRLSISIRSHEHYETCLSAKRIELTEPFRAKLGWAVGNIYGRVGTQDWDAAKLQDRLNELTSSSIVWVPDEKQREHMLAGLDALSAAGQAIDSGAIRGISKKYSSKKDQLLTLIDGLMEGVGIEETMRKAVEKRLRSDPQLPQLVKA